MEWAIYSKIENLYAYLRDKRGYDAMDEYIREDVLLLKGDYPPISCLPRCIPALPCYFSIIATTSISTNAPFGRDLTATAERAGNGSAKNSA